MSQFNLDEPINPLVKTGTELADDLSGPDKWRDALNSLHSGTIDFTSSDIEVLASNIIELPGGHGLTFIVDQTIRTAGFGTGANNGIFKVTAFSGDQITVDGPLTIEASGASVTINNLRPAYAQAGTTWLDKSLDPIWSVFIYDGADDILIRQLDINLSIDLNRAVTIYSEFIPYKIDDHIVDVGVIYKSLVNDNLDNTPASNPTEWEVATSVVSASASVKGINFLPARLQVGNGVDVSNDLNFNAGNFFTRFGSFPANSLPVRLFSQLVKQLDADWAVGTNAGGRPAITTETGTYSTTGVTVNGTGTLFLSEFFVGDVIHSDTEGEARRIVNVASNILMTIESAFGTDVVSDTAKKNGKAPNTTYHCFGLTNDDGSVVDCGVDTNAVAINLRTDAGVIAAGLTGAGRVFSILTDDSNNIRLFEQINRRCILKVILADGNFTDPGTTAANYTLTVPVGITVKPIVDVGFTKTSIGISHGLVYNLSVTPDPVPSPTLYNIIAEGNRAEQSVYNNQINTNFAGQIRIILSASDGTTILNFTNSGWIDETLN